MPERAHVSRAIAVLALVVAALVPASIAAAVQGELAWYNGLGLFYGALGSAEIVYLMGLLVLFRAQRAGFIRFRS